MIQPTLPFSVQPKVTFQASNQALKAKPSVFAKTMSLGDTLHFGANGKTTFLLQPYSLVVTVHGMFGPESSVKELTANLIGDEHEAYSTKVPAIQTAQLLGDARDFYASQVDNKRTERAKTTISDFSRRLEAASRKADRLKVIQQTIGLDDSDLGCQVANVVDAWLKTPTWQKSAQQIQRLNASYPFRHREPKPGYATLSKALEPSRKLLLEMLKDSVDLPENQMSRVETLQKIRNRVMDRLAPRAVAVGHSMGGMTTAKTAIEKNNDSIGVGISLGSPLKGTEEVPESLKFIEKAFPRLVRPVVRKQIRAFLGAFFPAIHQMGPNSQTVKNMQNTAAPFDTTLISIANPKDGLVTSDNARHNEAFPARLNLVVTPLESENLEDLLHHTQKDVVKMAKKNPLVKSIQSFLTTSKAMSGFKHHCGLVQHFHKYWSDQGDMLSQIFEGPDALNHMKRILHPHNYEAARARALELLVDRLDEKPELKKKYEVLVPELEAIAREPIPFDETANQQAKEVLKRLR